MAREKPQPPEEGLLPGDERESVDVSSPIVKVFPYNLKDKGKPTASTKSKNQVEVPPLNGVTKKRRLVLKSAYELKESKSKIPSEIFLDLNFFSFT